MNRREVARLTDTEVELGFRDRVSRDRRLTVELLLFLGEMMHRRLYAPAGCSSMFRYCVERCAMSADVAFRWTRVARASRAFPQLLEMIADGRLGLTSITLLAPRLNTETAPWLLPAAAGLSNREVGALLARHWPKPDAPTLFRVLSETNPSPAPSEANPGAPSELAALPIPTQLQDVAAAPAQPGSAEEALEPSPDDAPPAPLAPLAPQRRYFFQCTLDSETVELLERAKALAPVKASTEVDVLKAALAAHVLELEWRRFAATTLPRASRASARDSYIPNHVRREVWMRDQGRCTFEGEGGHVCGAREALEFDHVVPVAKGGDSRPSNVRLRCRTHNQLEAERVFGRSFMEGKRQAAPA